MDNLELLIDLHKSAYRQGPGSDLETQKAIDLAGIDKSAPLKIADIGCGTGASALHLASSLNAQIKAVDFLPAFIDVLKERADNEGLSNKITPLVASMEDLPFKDEEFDIIWSEGAIYNMGFAKGVNEWKRFLKPGGILVVSEITWLTGSRPDELEEYWQQAYSEIDTASAKVSVLEKAGYSPLGYFQLPENCWLGNYYGPLLDEFSDFLYRNDNSEAARAIVEEEEKEIEMYEAYKEFYSYGVYIAKKLD